MYSAVTGWIASSTTIFNTSAEHAAAKRKMASNAPARLRAKAES